jgi:hypothetical protein
MISRGGGPVREWEIEGTEWRAEEQDSAAHANGIYRVASAGPSTPAKSVYFSTEHPLLSKCINRIFFLVGSAWTAFSQNSSRA